MNSNTLTRLDGGKVRALVVDDEESITQLVSMALRYEGWDVQTASTGQEALEKMRTFAPDVAVLDIMLPDYDGMQLLSRIRSDGDMCPVLFLTALDSIEDRVNGLTAGGDDYVVKPFSLEELIARLRGLVRRSQVTLAERPDPVLRVGDLTLNEDSYDVMRGGASVVVTNTEFELLRYLMRNPGRVLSKAQILDRVWAYDFTGKSTVVELYISYLRKKIDAGREPMLHTVRGAGYMLKPVV
ncbi:two-component system OmpR family response regulator [Leucobacter exalbidus]|uniref:Two-component system OmpR family response regulator n=1 Tax=Leucobacter exalbidus TaxID=662960 RepID=A0A940PN36_9MICO|nr:response regulator transcription factor [Leucobacter exalbidus]MBP1326992.1 two-component system OmpR family response regulator [Leucobacter exalbidus]